MIKRGDSKIKFKGNMDNHPNRIKGEFASIFFYENKVFNNKKNNTYSKLTYYFSGQWVSRRSKEQRQKNSKRTKRLAIQIKTEKLNKINKRISNFFINFVINNSRL